MSTTDKTAGIFGPSAEQLAQQEAALNKFYGDKMLSSLGAGAGVGLGATAIYHLLRSLKQPGKKEKKYQSYGSGSPVPAKMASFAPVPQPPVGLGGPYGGFNPNASRPFLDSMNPTGRPTLLDSMRPPSGRVNGAPKPQQTFTTGMINDPATLQNMRNKFQANAAPAAAQSALASLQPKPFQPNGRQPITTNWKPAPGQQPDTTGADGSPRFTLPQAEQDRIYGLMGQGKSAFDLSKLQEAIGGMLPKTLIPFGAPSLPGGSAPSSDPHAWRKAWGTAANLGAGALGLYGGKKVVDSVMQAKKKKDLEAEMEAARQDYYSALRGDKAASSLDFAFETVKHANVLDTIGNMGSAVFNAPQNLRTAYLLAMLGAGGVGAKYMYDKTKERTVGENLARAQASRARTKGLPPVWVDPESLAQVKTLAGSHE